MRYIYHSYRHVKRTTNGSRLKIDGQQANKVTPRFRVLSAFADAFQRVRVGSFEGVTAPRPRPPPVHWGRSAGQLCSVRPVFYSSCPDARRWMSEPPAQGWFVTRLRFDPAGSVAFRLISGAASAPDGISAPPATREWEGGGVYHATATAAGVLHC